MKKNKKKPALKSKKIVIKKKPEKKKVKKELPSSQKNKILKKTTAKNILKTIKTNEIKKIPETEKTIKPQLRKESNEKIIIGVTGGIASGKKTVGRILSNQGARVISADEIYTELIKINKPLYKTIISKFSSKILDEEKNIDRKKLGNIVFSNPAKLKILNNITHPEIIKSVKHEIKNSSKKVIVLLAPLLFESFSTSLVDTIWVINLNKKNQINRLSKRDGLNSKDAQLRIDSQMPLEKKVKMANIVIDNNCEFAETKKHVINAWQKIIARLKEMNKKLSKNVQ